MLKKNIIRKNFEFQEIIDRKVQIVSKSIILYYRDNDKFLRVGISVSKRFANAVQRNRQKRQVRAIIDQLDFFDFQKDIVIILRKAFLIMGYQQKKEEIKKIFMRLKNAK